MKAFEISLSGLNVEWQRLQIIAENIANINTTRTENGDTYLPRRLLSGPEIGFEAALQDASQVPRPTGVRVVGVQQMADGVRQVLDPDHPHANADGFVRYPKIDHSTEMTLLIKTSRTYEANLTAFSIARQMYSSALEMGRGS